jgi:hypothetical protein
MRLRITRFSLPHHLSRWRRGHPRLFHTGIQGVAMHKPNEGGYNRPDVFLMDDWR